MKTLFIVFNIKYEAKQNSLIQRSEIGFEIFVISNEFYNPKAFCIRIIDLITIRPSIEIMSNVYVKLNAFSFEPNLVIGSSRVVLMIL